MMKNAKSKWAGTELAWLEALSITTTNAQTYLTDTGLDPREYDEQASWDYVARMREMERKNRTGYAMTDNPTPKQPSLALATELQDRQDKLDQLCNGLLYDMQRLVAHSYATGYADWSKGHLTREANAIDLCNEVETILHAFAQQL